MAKILEMQGIIKSFAGVPVLKDINIELNGGEILGIVGENGAGKSTLMNILGGVHLKDEGRMMLDGIPYDPSSPKDAKEQGIAFIHQELNLFSNLSVAENMYIENFPMNKFGGVDFRSIYKNAKDNLREYGLRISPGDKVETLPMGTQQVVEIVKALMKKARIIIFDEPTTSLSRPEKQKLFGTINDLKKKGIAVLFISHILDDVQELCDRIAILRDGALVGTFDAAGLKQSEIIRHMVGRELNKVYPEIEKDMRTDLSLDVENLNQGSKLKDISFSIKQGEILGLYGIIGAGRTELAKALFGIDPVDSGEIRVRGKTIRSLSPKTCINMGIAFVTEDRRSEGLLLSKSVRNNITLIKLKDFLGRLGIIRQNQEIESMKEMVKNLNIKVNDTEMQPVISLSGGNQQKVVFGKWVMNKPEIFILDEPTRGVDVGAKLEIYTIIGEMARNGSGILFISSEMEELMGICDRILVMKEGRISGSVDKNDFDQVMIGNLAL